MSPIIDAYVPFEEQFSLLVLSGRSRHIFHIPPILFLSASWAYCWQSPARHPRSGPVDWYRCAHHPLSILNGVIPSDNLLLFLLSPYLSYQFSYMSLFPEDFAIASNVDIKFLFDS